MVRETDGQTDRQTDRQTDGLFLSLIDYWSAMLHCNGNCGLSGPSNSILSKPQLPISLITYSRTSIIRPPLGSGPWIGVRIREMFRIRRMSTCAHYMYLISKVVENYDLSCPSRTSTRLHIHRTSNTNITSMMF